ncbi:unnamed protein product [Chondrus crispus]|uniref:FAD-binding domain-containing protein n=1 Tax=Chondrus crispus TaxID=2769 RepID=R7QL17_CHOCR|nr:unnamed protein product [Chondrus crispus]CDF38080.1 unnamed protein product [Chondrus crispus]|eukprot:XP_005717949.1 unnamed protein product [Chondrus crispus]
MSTEPTTPDVIVVGAGLAGSLLALLLSQAGLSTHVYDYRADPRNPTGEPTKRSRSINLAISTRGLTALAEAGLSEKVTAIGVPMHGRCVHPPSASSPLQLQRYGQPGEYLLSVSRHRLNNLLLDACQEAKGITLVFGTRCVDADLDAPAVTLQPRDGGESVRATATLIVGADGSFSKVRAAMARRDRFNFSQSYVSAAYKELTMVNLNPDTAKHAFPAEWLHIWPRHRFMLIALPNDATSFTCTLFMDKDEIDDLDSTAKIHAFFMRNFPDAVKCMPMLAEDFANNPTPSLLTIRCDPYNYMGKAIIIGDAAHAIVPFYGQGCNAAFEDCRLFVDSVKKHGWGELKLAAEEYASARKKNADAIADLAIDHYEDMRLEVLANRLFPQSFLPLYSMISFSNTPYAEAVERADKQEMVVGRGLLVVGAAAVGAAAVLTARRYAIKARPM